MRDLTVNDVPRCRGPRRICKEIGAARIRAWVREEAGILDIRADREFVDRCVSAGALGASHLVHGRYLRERRSLVVRVQEAFADHAEPTDLEAFLARVAPRALRRLESRRA